MNFLIFPAFLSVAVLVCVGIGVIAIIKKGRSKEAKKDEDKTA